MDTLAQVAVIAAFVLVFGGGFYGVFRHKASIKRTWKEFAEAHGLTLTEGALPQVSGTLEGRAFTMGASGGGAKQGVPTVVGFTISAGINGTVPAGLVAGKRGWSQGPGPVQTGDAGFDKAVWIECPDRAAALAWLTPARRAALLEVAELGAVALGPAQGQPARVARQQEGYKARREWFEDQRARFLKLAAALDG